MATLAKKLILSAALGATIGAGRLLAADCADIVLIGNDGWRSTPIAKSRCNGIWSVESHTTWSHVNDWPNGPASFQTAAATARVTLGGDYDGDGTSDIAVLGKDEAWFAFARDNGIFRYWQIQASAREYHDFLVGANLPGVQAVAGHFVNEPPYLSPGTQIVLVGGPNWGSFPMLTRRAFEYFRVENLPAPSSSSATPQDFSEWANAERHGAQAFALDVNGDGYDDIALVGGSSGGWPWGSIPVAVSDGAGRFTPYNIFGYGAWDLGWLSSGSSTGDFAGWAAQSDVTRLPGHFLGAFPGVALIGGSGWASIPVAHALLSNEADGTLSRYGGFWVWNHFVPEFPYFATQARFKLTGDFDGDGQTDIALVGQTSAALGVNARWNSIPVALATSPWGTGFDIKNAPPYGYAPTVADFVSLSTQDHVKALAADFTGDGKTDIALVGGIGWTVLPLAISNGDGSFTIRIDPTPGNDIGWPVSSFGWWAGLTNARPIAGQFIRTDSTLGRMEPAP